MMYNGGRNREPEGGQEALNSIITQYRTQIKHLKSNEKHLQEEVQKLKLHVVSLKYQRNENPNNEDAAEDAGGREWNLEARSPSSAAYSQGQDFCLSDDLVLDGVGSTDDLSVSVCDDPRRLLRKLVEMYHEKLKEVRLLEVKSRVQDVQTRQAKAIARNVLDFLIILEKLVVHSDVDASLADDLPVWIRLILEKSDSRTSISQMRKAWKVLLWSLHNISGSEKSLPAVSEAAVDTWYARFQPEVHRDIGSPDKELADLFATLCSDVGVKPEGEGLARSILVPEEQSPDVSVDDSAAKLRMEDLQQFRSIGQQMLEMTEESVRKEAVVKANHDDTVLERQLSELYLPQKESMETYDLGNLLMTTNAVIQSMTDNFAGLESSGGRLCRQCKQPVDDGSVRAVPAESHAFKKPVLHSRLLSGSPMSPPQGLSSGLRSREATVYPTAGVSGSSSVFQPVPHLLPASATQPVKHRLRPGTFRGANGPLPPSQLTLIRNSNGPTRSKSYSNPESALLRRKELVDHAKSSSLDSVFPSGTQQTRMNDDLLSTNAPKQSRAGDQSVSDSDEEYEVRGPPDTPPEVRARAFQTIQTADKLLLESRPEGDSMYGQEHCHHPDDKEFGLMQDSYVTAIPHLQVRSHEQRAAPGSAYSQVQQCTGASVSSQHDMLLPSSVEWSTIQLKDGGMRSPTLEAMRSTSTVRLAEQSQRDRRCAICKQPFITSTSMAVINAHIQNHLQRQSPEGSATEYALKDDATTDATSAVASATAEGSVSRHCPVCNVQFPSYVPVQAIQSHINLHFDGNDSFEIVGDSFGPAHQ